MGLQLRTPLPELIVTPVTNGAVVAKVNRLVGTSGSLAANCTVFSRPSSNVSVPGLTRAGARLTSVTITVKACVVFMLGLPSSLTRTTITFVLGPCASLGDQVNTPLVASMAAPVGAPGSRLNVRFCAGRSLSVAVTVKVMLVSSGSVRPPMVGTEGGLFTLFTVTLKLLLSVYVGIPLSDTRAVKL